MQPSGNLLTNPMVPPAQDPSGAIGATGQAIKNYVCQYRREIYAASAVAALSTSGGALVPAGLTALATWYFCEPPPPGGNDIPGLPGVGGRCATPYTITVKSYVQTLGNNGVVTGQGVLTMVGNTVGPLGSVRANRRDYSGFAPSDFAYFQVYAANGGGAPLAQVSSSTTVPLSNTAWRIAGDPVWSVVRRDGGSDNCGNIPVSEPTIPPVFPTFPVTNIFAPVTNNFGLTWYMPISIGPITIPVKVGPFALNIGINGLSIPIDINGNFYLSGSGVTGTTTSQDEKKDEEPNPQPDGGGGGSTTIRLVSYDCDGEPILDTTRTGQLPGLLAPVIQDLNNHNQARFDVECGDEQAEYVVVAIGAIASTVENQFSDTGGLDEEIKAILIRLNDTGDLVTPYRYSGTGQIQGKFGIFSWGHLAGGLWHQEEGKMQWFTDGYYEVPKRYGAAIRVRYTAPIGITGTIYGLRKLN